MRRHLFTVPVIPKLEESNGRLDFFLDEGSVGVHVELDMLDPSLIPDQSLVGQLETRGHDFTGNPLDAHDVDALGRTVALQLHAEGRWDDAATLPDVHEYPTVAWAPALVLRPRNRTGLVQAFQDIAAQIDAAQRGPGRPPAADRPRPPPPGHRGLHPRRHPHLRRRDRRAPPPQRRAAAHPRTRRPPRPDPRAGPSRHRQDAHGRRPPHAPAGPGPARARHRPHRPRPPRGPHQAARADQAAGRVRHRGQPRRPRRPPHRRRPHLPPGRRSRRARLSPPHPGSWPSRRPSWTSDGAR